MIGISKMVLDTNLMLLLIWLHYRIREKQQKYSLLQLVIIQIHWSYTYCTHTNSGDPFQIEDPSFKIQIEEPYLFNKKWVLGALYQEKINQKTPKKSCKKIVPRCTIGVRTVFTKCTQVPLYLFLYIFKESIIQRSYKLPGIIRVPCHLYFQVIHFNFPISIRPHAFYLGSRGRFFCSKNI